MFAVIVKYECLQSLGNMNVCSHWEI